MRHEVRAGPAGSVRLKLTVAEREALRALIDELRPIISGGRPAAGEEGPSRALRGRLYPRAYDDPLDELEYSELNANALTETRTHALDVVATTLAAGQVKGEQWSAKLDAGEAAAWLSAVNDGRLILAEVVGIDHEEDWEDARESDDQVAVMLNYLSLLEEELVDALARGLDG